MIYIFYVVFLQQSDLSNIKMLPPIPGNVVRGVREAAPSPRRRNLPNPEKLRIEIISRMLTSEKWFLRKVQDGISKLESENDIKKKDVIEILRREEARSLKKIELWEKALETPNTMPTMPKFP